MIALKHILVPIDFDEPAMHALDLAIALAAKFGSKLTLLHAYMIPITGYGYAESLYWPIDDLADLARKEMRAVLTTTQMRHPQTESMVVCSDPWHAILEAARERGADLIVMGTHGRRGVSRALLGSVAEKVVRLSTVPVLTVSGREEREEREKALTDTSRAA